MKVSQFAHQSVFGRPQIHLEKCLKIDAVVSQDRPTFRSVYKTITNCMQCD